MNFHRTIVGHRSFVFIIIDFYPNKNKTQHDDDRFVFLFKYQWRWPDIEPERKKFGIVGWNCEHIISVGNSISGPSSNNDVETIIRRRISVWMNVKQNTIRIGFVFLCWEMSPVDWLRNYSFSLFISIQKKKQTAHS